MIKKFLVALFVLFNVATCAKASTELEETEIRMVCAICSMGAYSDKESQLMRSMVTERGWQIETLSQKNNRANAKAYLVSKGNTKILTIAGTESWKDIEVDFRVGRVRLNEDESIDPKEKIASDEIFLHRGFRDYTDLVLGDGLAERLVNSLNQNPYETLYLTGHSLGGAVATIAAIRLTDAGIPKNQLKVITFAAPAVGSQALANAYENKIDLTRVLMKGDVIKKSLHKLGYVQFGKVLEYERTNASSKHFKHLMSVYLDCAIRDYLNAGGNFRYETQNKIYAPIYVAPILVVKDSLPVSYEEIIFNTLNDGLTNHFGDLTFAAEKSLEIQEDNDFDDNFSEFATAAKNNNCKYVLIRILKAKKIRDTLTGGRHVTLEEIILDENGLTLSMQTSGASTTKLTIFEAVLTAQENLTENLENFFRGN
ncbi:MAG: lipase family protein [Selenomonadaceae bacterium]|nr:lipase family protein [Selenomonadaceae bacterium]